MRHGRKLPEGRTPRVDVDNGVVGLKRCDTSLLKPIDGGADGRTGDRGAWMGGFPSCAF